MTQAWEYKVAATWEFTAHEHKHRGEFKDNFTQALNYLGGEGWELVSYTPESGIVVFKRPARKLRATTDNNLCARSVKFLYVLLNRIGWAPRALTWECQREGYVCEWVYPYGFVPEAGCPRHD